MKGVPGRLFLLAVSVLLLFPGWGTAATQTTAHDPQTQMNHQQMDHSQMDHSQMDHGQMEVPLTLGEKTPREQMAAPDEWVQEQTGASLPLDAVFFNEQGQEVRLQELIDQPTLLLPVYYLCPKSCSFDLANLAEAIRRSTIPADRYRVISLSFSTEENPEIAAGAKKNYTELLPASFDRSKWSFLTGSENNIRKVTDSLGYRFQKQQDGTFIHPSALVALDKKGRIIKYVYGAFIAGDVDLALTEAEKGTPSSSIRRFLSFCFASDPRKNQQVFTVIKVGALAVLCLGGGLFVYFLRRKKTHR